jgi:hypothetical protein
MFRSKKLRWRIWYIIHDSLRFLLWRNPCARFFWYGLAYAITMSGLGIFFCYQWLAKKYKELH